MRRVSLALIGFFAAATAFWAAFAAMEKTPMDDPYLWLEDVHGQKPLDWVKAQNAKSLDVLKADPRYQPGYDFLLNVLDAQDRIPYGGLDHNHVYNFWQDAAHPKGLWRRTTMAEYQKPQPAWETLIDLDKLAADEKENWVWKASQCAPSELRCLISLSRGGGDAVVVREFDLASKSFVADGFYLKEAKSDVALVDDDTVLFGTDFGPGSMTTSGYPNIVKLWKRGQKTEDARKIYEGKLSDVSSSGTVLRSGALNLPVVVRGPSFFEAEYYIEAPDAGAAHKSHGGWFKLAVPRSAQLQGLFAGDNLLFTLREDWTPPGGAKIGKGSLVALKLTANLDVTPGKVVTLYSPSARSSIEGVATGRDAVYVSILDNVIGSVHAFRFHDGKWSDNKLALPPGGTTSIISTNDFGPDVLLGFESFLKPSTLYADNGSDHPHEIKALPARFDAEGMDTVQFQAPSSDGVMIPYFVVRPKNLRGAAPTILNGYGGFEISRTPYYSASFGKLWVGQGGVYVLANIRGGGEFGPAWHTAALKTNRQKAFDDFAAVAADLIKRGITTPKHLGIVGGSNGGLLVSTVMTQHPELLGAVVCQVPLIDMIRYTHIGAGASWIGEYGDPADRAMATYIRTYSPYQNVRKDKKYPPVFFVTATSDDRVTPVHARKMAARMEEQGHEVLFYENTDGGHAAAANHKQAAEMSALTLVYFARQLGLK